MDEHRINAYRAALIDRKRALVEEDALGEEGQKTVTLDQQSVGRLSRMDALQSQAMAKAQAARRDAERKRIVAALARIEAGDYGYCTECGDDLSEARLDIDPTLPRCMSCTLG